MIILEVFAVFILTFVIVGLAIAVVELIAGWKLFEKAHVDGWKFLIPIYNLYVATVHVAKLDVIWFVFVFLAWFPVIGWVLSPLALINIAYSICRRFTKSSDLQIIGTIFFPIFVLVFAFGKYEYDDSNYSKNGFISDGFMDNVKDGFNGTTSSSNDTHHDTNNFCKNCGNKIHKGDKFCENCGNKL